MVLQGTGVVERAMANRLDLRFTYPQVEALWQSAQPSTHSAKDVLAGLVLLANACIGIARNVHLAGQCTPLTLPSLTIT